MRLPTHPFWAFSQKSDLKPMVQNYTTLALSFSGCPLSPRSSLGLYSRMLSWSPCVNFHPSLWGLLRIRYKTKCCLGLCKTRCPAWVEVGVKLIQWSMERRGNQNWNLCKPDVKPILSNPKMSVWRINQTGNIVKVQWMLELRNFSHRQGSLIFLKAEWNIKSRSRRKWGKLEFVEQYLRFIKTQTNTDSLCERWRRRILTRMIYAPQVRRTGTVNVLIAGSTENWSLWCEWWKMEYSESEFHVLVSEFRYFAHRHNYHT